MSISLPCPWCGQRNLQFKRQQSNLWLVTKVYWCPDCSLESATIRDLEIGVETIRSELLNG